MTATLAVPVERIERTILLIRGQKVMLDSDLAELYGVSTKRLNEQVRRNASRFPPDFMFQLTTEEAEDLRSQIATSKGGRGGRRYLPYVFTEQGVAMLSSVLKSDRAVQVNIEIMRAFVRLRYMIATHEDLARRLAELEHRQDEHAEKFAVILELLQPPEPDAEPSPEIGFHVKATPKRRSRKVS